MDGDLEKDEWKKVQGPGLSLGSFEPFIRALTEAIKAEEEAVKQRIEMLSRMGLLGDGNGNSIK